jgi:hypothetical protein
MFAEPIEKPVESPATGVHANAETFLVACDVTRGDQKRAS